MNSNRKKRIRIVPLSVSPHVNCLHKCHQISKNCIWVSPIHLMRLPVWVKTKTCNGAFWVLGCWFCLTIHQRQLSRVSETKNFVSNLRVWSWSLSHDWTICHVRSAQITKDLYIYLSIYLYIYRERLYNTYVYICINIYIYAKMKKVNTEKNTIHFVLKSSVCCINICL